MLQHDDQFHYHGAMPSANSTGNRCLLRKNVDMTVTVKNSLAGIPTRQSNQALIHAKVNELKLGVIYKHCLSSQTRKYCLWCGRDTGVKTVHL